MTLGQGASGASLIPGTLTPEVPFQEFPRDGWTDFTLLIGDDPVRLGLAPSPTALDERFNVRLSSRGQTYLQDLTLRWEKESGLPLETAPAPPVWRHSILLDRGDVASIEAEQGEGYYEVFFTFVGAPTTIFWFNLDWFDFNRERTDFAMVFDANGVEPPAHMPLPGALGLLGSALGGILVLRRRRPRLPPR